MKTSRFLILITACCLLMACTSEPVAEPGPLVEVNGHQISRQAFMAAFERSRPPGQPLSATERLDLQRSMLVEMIDRALIYAEADRLGIKVTPTEVSTALEEYRHDYPEGGFEEMLNQRGLTLIDWQAELEESLIMEKLLEEAVYTRVTVSDMEIANYFEAHRDEFDRPEQVRARQIVVADETEGQKVMGLLRQGEAFEEIAREYSLSPDSQDGGDLGFFGRGEMPAEFDAVVFDLPVGRLSELVKSEYGYHIFLVEKKRAAARLGKKDAEQEIRTILETGKREDVYQEWLQNLRSQATIAVDWAQLEEQGQSTQ